MYKNSAILFVSVALFSAGLLGTAHAQQDNETTNFLSGSSYNCFFFTTLDVFNSRISFGEPADLSFSRFGGAGYYIALLGSFASVYFSTDESLGQQTGDIFIAMSGVPFDPFIVGAGTVVLQYQQVAPMIFWGSRVQ